MTKQELIVRLQRYIDDQSEVDTDYDDDFNPADTYGGNYDDCYYAGTRAGITYGKAVVAQEVLKFLSTAT